jgi:tripartite-type tricarboxylate transporter receptor subunit TctC
MSTTSKWISVIGAAMCALVTALPAAAQSPYPNRPVRIIVPYPPGGTVDLVGRTIAQRLSEQIGQQFVVENRAGASGTIGSDAVAKANPDGYTLLVNASLHVANPFIMKSIPFDAVKDFTAVSMLGSVPLLMTTSANNPWNTMKEFLDAAKANPGKYTFATSGLGSASHLAEEMVKRQLGLDIQIVLYKGTAPALTDIMGGQVSAMIDALPASYAHVKGGRLKPLGVTSKTRVPFLPNVPTAEESGLPGFEMSSWYGVWGPAKLPTDVTARLADEVAKAVQSKELKDRLETQAFISAGLGPAEFSKYIESEMVKYARIVKEANIKQE